MPLTEKIRVIIVDDITETRENIRRMLQFDNFIEVIGAARTGREAIELSQQSKPDVIVMDINMPDMDGITATQEIKKKQSYIQVVILSVQNDPNYMRRAMLAGARDFLSKPPMIDELTDAVRRAGIMAQEERLKSATMTQVTNDSFSQMNNPGSSSASGKILVVYSPKGGTGRTFLAVNLAMALKDKQNRVAIVDGNLQFGDVAVFINEQGKNTILELAPRVDELDDDVVKEVMITHRTSGVDFLAAPPRPEYADKISGEQFGKLLKYLRQIYQYVVVDTSSYLTETVQVAIDVADQIILISTQDIPSIKNCSLFLQLADASGITRDQITFVINRYDKRISITPEKIRDNLRQEVAVVIPLDEKYVNSSIIRGVPLMLDASRTQECGKKITQLTEIVRARVSKNEPEPSSK